MISSCPQITRDASSGEVILIDRGVINANTLIAKGFDTSMRYSFDTDRWPGEFTFSLDHSYIDTLETEFDGPSGPEIEVDAGEIPTPENRARGTVGWRNDELSLRWKTLYWGEANDGAELADGSILTVDAHWKHDLYAGYDLELFGTDTTVYAGVNNVLDEDPPLLLDGSEYGEDYNTHSSYDLVGRYWYVGFDARF